MTQPEAMVLAAVLSAAISLIVAIISYLGSKRTQLEVEAIKQQSAKDLELLKGQVAERRSESDARRDYEYEARKKLYEKCEPLLFQLYELSDNALHRIYSLARTARIGSLGPTSSWLSQPGYYMASTAYHLLAPVAIFKLIQKLLTFVDLAVEPHIKAQYDLIKQVYLSFTDDFEFARGGPAVEYNPNIPDWRERRLKDPEHFWRQGLPVGRLDVAVEGLIIREPSGLLRLKSFGEFEADYYDQDSAVGKGFVIVSDMFLDFHPKSRPVLWRMLIAQAHIYNALLQVSHGGPGRGAVLIRPIPEEERKSFDWRQEPAEASEEAVKVDPFSVAVSYLSKHLGGKMAAEGPASPKGG